MSKIRDVARAGFNVIRTGTLVKRNQAPYATHLPVLLGLATLTPIRNVLEFGSGTYSTLAFLNKIAFPELKNLKSFENDKKWSEKVLEMCGQDPRLDLVTVSGLVTGDFDTNKVSNYDLVFVDDSYRSEHRAHTIRLITSSKPNILVIHDYENLTYRYATREAINRYRVKAILPNVGIVWNNPSITKAKILVIESLIARYAKTIAADDISAWAKIFEESL